MPVEDPVTADFQILVGEASGFFGSRLASANYAHRTSDLPDLAVLREPTEMTGIQALRDALKVAHEMKRVFGPSTIRAWFVGRNPLLGDQMPALAITDAPEQVMNAAKVYADL